MKIIILLQDFCMLLLLQTYFANKTLKKECIDFCIKFGKTCNKRDYT